MANSNLIVEQDGNTTDFKYVVLKVNKIKSKKLLLSQEKQKTLVQIVDMSDKILYNESKAEQSFKTTISAAFSHELRNPLNSLSGQIISMKSLFHSFDEFISISKQFM